MPLGVHVGEQMRAANCAALHFKVYMYGCVRGAWWRQDATTVQLVVALEEQVAASAGMSGPANEVPMKLTHAIT